MIAVYPGTFDPLTKGHEDILNRSAKIFDKIILAISNSPSKNPMLTLEERTMLARKSMMHHQNIEICGFSGMLIDFLKEKQAQVLIRGCRNIIDAEYELSLQGMYKALMPELEVILLPANPSVSYISSSLVRDVYIHHGDTSPFVNKEINDFLIQKTKIDTLNNKKYFDH